MNQNLQQLLTATPSWVTGALRNLANDEAMLENLLEEFTERAGIMEFMGGQTRYLAEKNALQTIITNHQRRLDGG